MRREPSLRRDDFYGGWDKVLTRRGNVRVVGGDRLFDFWRWSDFGLSIRSLRYLIDSLPQNIGKRVAELNASAEPFFI